MASASSIVVKKNDNTTDITYAILQPASGDGTAAIWKATSVGSAPAHQPELRASSRAAQGQKGREVRLTFKYPQIATNTTTGVTSVIDMASAVVTFTFPMAMAQGDINESVAQLTNLLDSALINSVLKEGYAPT